MVAMTGPVTSCIASSAARFESVSPASRWRLVFSTTTMASSTTIPITSTRPKSESWLIEKPRSAITANVPTSATGIVSAGISVARKFCRNT